MTIEKLHLFIEQAISDGLVTREEVIDKLNRALKNKRYFHVIFVSGEGTVYPSQKLFTTEEKASDYSKEFMSKCIFDNDLPILDPYSKLTVLEYMVTS